MDAEAEIRGTLERVEQEDPLGGTYRSEIISRLRQVRPHLEQKLGREPSVAELGEALEVIDGRVDLERMPDEPLQTTAAPTDGAAARSY